MRTAALYDIHGNIHALEAVLDAVERHDPDLIVIGGDVASGPFPRETTERLWGLDRPARFVMGNADRELIDAFGRRDEVEGPDFDEDAEWCAGQLSSQHIDFFRAFEPTVTLEGPGGRIVFCHGSPRSDEEVITPATPAARIEPMLEGLSPGMTVVCGHTHMQFDRSVGGIRVVNAGSVGMPYERGPGAYWALVGETIELLRTHYDLPAAAKAIAASGWPPAQDFARENVLEVPPPEEAIAVFEPPPSSQ